jgi:hypothetical protein
MSDEIAAILARILARPLGEVVAARDEAVRELRREKRAAEAAEIAGLRRPSPPLWAVDRLHAVDPQGVGHLLDAGAEMRAAQAALLAGEPDAAARLARAGARLNDTVQRSAEAATHLLLAEGHGAGAEAERRLLSMLRAASVGDDDTRAALREGRLLAEPQPAGFDLLAAAPTPARPTDAAPRETPAAAVVEPPADRRARRRELQRAVAERREAYAQAEREGAARRARVAALAKEIAALRRRVDSLQRELDAEREEAAAADAAARTARAALDRATAALEG